MTWLREVGRAIRGLGRRRSFTAVAIATVALGVGANALVFSVVKAVLLDGLPYPDSERLVMVSGVRTSTGAPYPLSYLDIEDLAREARGLDGLVARTEGRSFNLLADGEGENVTGELVGSAYFTLLGVEPALGRLLRPEEDLEGEHTVVVLGHDLWVRSFGADPAVLGRTIELDGRTFEVVGVAAEGFEGVSDDAELWLPMTMAPTLYGPIYLANRQFRWLAALGRASPGTTVEQAALELEARAADLRQRYVQENLEIGVAVEPLAEYYFGDLRPRLLLLWGAAGFVLLIAAANLASLLLARGTARSHEVALRAALGAGRAHLAGLTLVEALVVAAAGSAIGVVAAGLLIGPVVEAAAVGLPGFTRATLDVGVVATMAGLSALAALLAALAPSLAASRVTALAALSREGRDQPLGRGKLALLRGFVVAQVAVALVLVVAVGLTVQGFQRLMGSDLGFEPHGVVTARFDLKAPRFQPNEAYWDFAAELQRRAEAVPGVERAALLGPQPPVGAWNGAEVAVEARMEAGLDPNGLVVVTRSVTPGYFETMGIPLLTGRDFSPADRNAQETELVVVVNRRFAETYFEGSALGQRIKLSRPEQNGPFATVVGVVGDVVDGGPGAESRPSGLHLYYSVYQVTPRFPPMLSLVTRADPALAGPAAVAIGDLTADWAPDVPPFDVRALVDLIGEQTAGQRFLVWLMSGFALLAVALAAVGLYGVMAYTVHRQVREIGVRLALGAAPPEILRMTLGRSLRIGLAGAGVGVLAAYLGSRALEAHLYGVSATDPWTFAGAAALVVGVTVLAAVVPAVRAARTDPGVSMSAAGS